MYFLAITKTKEEADKLHKLSGMGSFSRCNPYGWNQKWIDRSPGVSWGIEWWKDEQLPVPNPKWRQCCYWQGDRDLPTFFAYIQREETQRKEIHMMNFAKLKELFPILDWDVTEENFYFAVRVKTQYGGGSGASPVSLSDEHFEDMKQWLSGKAWKKKKKEQLRAVYPFLFFAPDSSPDAVETSPAMQAFIGAGSMWKVFLSSYNEYTDEDYCSTSTGYFFEMPMDIITMKKLRALDQESKKARRKGWFFCTICQIAKPQVEYGYYFFAETRCKNCLDPAWEKRARAETYN